MHKSLSAVFVCLLALVIDAGFSQAGAGVTPFFRYCGVASNNASGGVATLIRAEVNDPNGQVPSSIKKITVQGPGGFLVTLKPADYSASDNTFIKTVPGAPAEGEYTFTVLDAVGDTATSYYRVGKVTILPVVDSNTFVASGSLASPALSWSDVAGYEGNLLFRVVISDDGGNRVWLSPDLTGITNVTVPSGILDSGKTYHWSVTALDNSQAIVADNRSMSDTAPLAIGTEKAGFLYARVYTTKYAGGKICTELDARVTIPGGNQADITSLVVSGPNGFSYTFAPEDFNSSSWRFLHETNGTPESGTYTFVLTSTRGTAQTCHYYSYVDLPLVDVETLQASEAGTAQRLTWAAPESGARSLFYSVTGRDKTTKSNVFSVATVNPYYNVPASTSLNSSVEWIVDVRDMRWPYQPNNIARSGWVDFVVDNSRPNFYMGSGVYALNLNGAASTILDVYVYDPLTQSGLSKDMSLVVTGPGGFSYTVQDADLSVPPLTAPSDYEYYHPVDPVDGALLGDGTYAFTLNYGGGKSIVTHEMLQKGATVPVVDESTLQVSGDPLAPTISWGGISGYPAHLFYRVKVFNSDGITIFNSSRTPYTALTMASGTLQSGQSYTYRVEAQDDASWPLYNNRSNSAILPLVISQDTAPGAPTGVTATAGDASAEVSFTAPANNGGSAITSYTVISSPGKIKASGKSSPITIGGLTNGVAYTFTVTATNAVGKSTKSDPSAPVTPDVVPGAPADVTATAGNGMAKVSFTSPVPNGGTPITSYTVTSYPGEIKATGTRNTIKVTGLTNGTAYKFRVTATNAKGAGPASAKSNKVVPATAPDAPTGVTAVPKNASAQVYFSAPASDGGSPITSYVVTANRKGITASGAASPIKVKGLKNGKTYKFTVKAVNAVGTGPASSESNEIVAGPSPVRAPGFVR